VNARKPIEQGFARKHRDDLGNDSHGGQDQDVHLGVAEEPEQMLPQQRASPLGHIVEMRSKLAVQQQQDDRHA
jgi:hypothetical protein